MRRVVQIRALTAALAATAMLAATSSAAWAAHGMLHNNRTNPDGCTTRERIQLFYTVVIEATPHRGECVTPAGTIRPESAQILF